MGRFLKSVGLTAFAILHTIILASHQNWQISTRIDSNLADCLLKMLNNEDDKARTKNIRLSQETGPGLPGFIAGDIVNLMRASQRDLNLAYEILYSSKKPLLYQIHSRVIIVDSFASFRTIIEHQRMSAYDINGLHQKYYVVLTDYEEDTVNEAMDKILAFCLKKYIIHVNVLVEDSKGIVDIYTFFPFTENSCRKSIPEIYNRFIGGRFQWNRPIFPQKISNLWKCPLTAITWHKPPFVFLEAHDVSGIDGNFLKFLSRAMNFTLEFQESSQGIGEVYPNGTMRGSFKIVQDGDVDLMVGGTVCTNLRRKHLACSRDYYTSSMQIVLKKPAPYSSFEILLFPFDARTWYTLMIFLCLNLIIRRLLTKTLIVVKQRAQILSTRLSLVSWLFSITIIRSCYEGSIFRFLHKKPIRQPPQNYEAALAEGYRLLVKSTYVPFVKHIPGILDKLVLTEASLAKLFDEFDKYDGKYGLLNLDNYLTVIANDSTRYGQYVEVPEPMLHNIICVYLPKFSFLTKELNRQIEIMFNNGLMQRVYDISVTDKLRKMKGAEESGANSIPLMEIVGDFELLIYLIGVGWLLLGFEILTTKLRFVKKIVDFFH